MAWQLIYTSAPRSLEAGRSGFGTVARHRAISPLLVSAIERASQFSRLPGVDANRIIYSYRIVVVAGGRFHVLSSIRDAGADYTGRTNHIAHHLVAEPREVAHLGGAGPSPADVLLGMPWTTTWNEVPRYFEASEEIALTRFHPLVNGSAWARVAGRASQAWLLASGDGSRGAYVIRPDGVDLRQVFGESLRLIPERLWQISFTTSLQPSDEPADFRWIGIEPASPLRQQTETSGRPIFDLTAPAMLPLVEVEEPAVVSAPVVAVGAAIPPPSTLPGAPVFARPSAPGPVAAPPGIAPPAPWTAPSPRAPSRSARDPGRSGYPPRRFAGPKLWIIGGAAALLLIAVVALFVLKPIVERNDAIAAVAKEFHEADPGQYDDVTARNMAMALVGSWDKATRDLLIDASLGLIQVLQKGRLAELDSEAARENYRVLQNADNGQLPSPLHRLRSEIEEIRRLEELPDGFDSEMDAERLKQMADKRCEEFRKIFPGSPSVQWQGYLVDDFQRKMDRLLADRLLRLAEESSGPYDGNSFEKEVDNIALTIRDSEALATIAKIKETLKKVRARQADASKHAATPDGSDKVREIIENIPGIEGATEKRKHGKVDSGSGTALKTGPGPPESAPTLKSVLNVPLYFVSKRENPASLSITELTSNLRYTLRDVDGKQTNLVDPANNNDLKASPWDPPLFHVLPEKKQIEITGAVGRGVPFSLSAQDAKGTEVFRIWMCALDGKPLFSPAADSLIRKGDSLEIDLSGFGVPVTQLLVKLPESCYALKEPSGLKPLLENRSVSLSESVKEMEQARAQWKQMLGETQAKLAEPPKDPRADFDRIAADLEGEVKLDKAEKKRLAPAAAPLLERCGSYLQVVSGEIALGLAGDEIFNAGTALKGIGGNSDAKKQADAIKVAENSIKDAQGKLTTQEQQMASGQKLTLLLNLVQACGAESPVAKAVHDEEMKRLKLRVESLKASLADQPPLLSKDKPPPGRYTVFAADGVATIPILQIDQP